VNAAPDEVAPAPELTDAGRPADEERLAAPAPPRTDAAGSAAAPGESASRIATLTARIVDERGTPLAGAELRARDGAERASSGADGSVMLRVDPDQELSGVIVAAHEGRATRYLRTMVRAGATIPLGEIALVPGGVLRGTVLDPIGRPVSGARVFVGSVEDARVDPATLRRLGPVLNELVHGIDVDAGGGFVLAGVAPGPARIWATAPDHGFVSHGPFEVATGANAPIELVLAPLSPVDGISGIALGADGTPVAATISYNYQHGDSHTYTSMRADVDGRFSLTVVSRSPHNFIFADPERHWPLDHVCR
jgi:hypothetical protein